MQQESKGSTLHGRIATCTEQDARRQGERRNRSQDASKHQGPPEAGTQLGGERHLWHSGWLQPDSGLFLSTQHKQRSKPNEQLSSQALPAGYLTKVEVSQGIKSQNKKLLCSPGAMSAERDPNTSRYQPFPYIVMFDRHSNLQP